MKGAVRKAFEYHYLFFILLLCVFGCKKTDIENDVLPPAISIPYHALNSEQDLDLLMQQIGDARIVLLGEASHGTHEYYQWRSAITKRLIQEKGFDAMAIEGEWADSYRVNNFIKGVVQDSVQAVTLLQQYNRWPTWMWGNYEIASLITWLNNYNQSHSTGKVGFYGLDVYCLWESIEELMPYLEGAPDSLKQIAQQVQQCFQPYTDDPQSYAYSVANSQGCKEQTERLWKAIYNYTGNTTATNEAAFVMQQNALVALNGERYYSAMISSDVESWNIRDNHMTQTVERLLTLLGDDSKIIIWEHNTHIGDARYTSMADEGTVNVGQLVREKYGEENVFAVGFGSYSGSVIAAQQWGGAIQTMPMPEAMDGSWEDILHHLGSPANKILFSNEIENIASLQKPIGHRAIGVVYNPAREAGNYVPSVIPKRYDAFIFIDRTTALHPINISPLNEPPDTYPSGY